MHAGDEDTASDDQFNALPGPSHLSQRQRRLRVLGGFGFVVLLAVGLGITTARESVPAGGSSSMTGMAMEPGMEHVSVELRDVGGQEFALPGGQPGAVLFMSTRGCADCLALARRISAASRSRPGFSLTFVSLDTEETRADFAAFDAAAGDVAARYALDDAEGSIARSFGVYEPGTIVVYDSAGMIRTQLDGSVNARTMARAVADA